MGRVRRVGNYVMLKAQVMTEIKSIVQTLTKEYPESPNYIYYSYFAPDLNNTGEILFLIYSTKLPNISQASESAELSSSIEPILHQFIEHDQFLEPSCPEFSQILNYLLSHPKSHLISKKETLDRLKQKLTTLRNNQWIVQSTSYKITDPSNPQFILHILRKEGNFAMMLQLNRILLPESQKKSIEKNSSTDESLTELKSRVQELIEEREHLLSIGAEKENEIHLLKSQLELGGSSFDDQVNSLQEKLTNLQNDLARRDDEILQLKAKLFDLNQEKDVLIQEKQAIEQKYLVKVRELEQKRQR